MEGIDEYGVGVAVVCDHKVLVAAAGADWEASCVICVERAMGFIHLWSSLMDLGCFLLLEKGGVVREGWPVLVEQMPCWD